ncbi:MAG: hypothetical protein ACP5H2_09620 [Solirubrobacteraceae bacterium]
MLLTALSFWQLALGLHVIIAVAALGVLVAYPLIGVTAERTDPRVVPTLHRVRVTIGRSLVNPGLALVLIAGLYLAGEHHLWDRFYVIFGIVAVVVLGAVEGALVGRYSKRLAEIARRDVDASGDGRVLWSDEYLALRAGLDRGNALMALIVIITVFLMVVR